MFGGRPAALRCRSRAVRPILEGVFLGVFSLEDIMALRGGPPTRLITSLLIVMEKNASSLVVSDNAERIKGGRKTKMEETCRRGRRDSTRQVASKVLL
jgi:hypothetical protein